MARTVWFRIALSLFLVCSTTAAHAVTSGAHLWSRGYGGTNAFNDVGNGVAVDPSRNVIIVGQFDGTANFGGSDLTSAGGGGDIFVAKYSPTGTHLWSKRLGAVTNIDAASGVAADGWGNIYVTGSFYGTVDFGNGALVSAGQQDVFLVKYSPAGTALWSKRFGDVSIDQANAVVADPTTGNPVIAGFYIGSPNFGTGALTAFGGFDIFVAECDATTGNGIYSRGMGGPGIDVANGLGEDALGEVFVTGYFNNTVNFGGSALVSAGSDDIFLAKYTFQLNHVWSQRFGSTGSDQGNGVAVDGASNVVMTGVFTNSVNFGGSPLASVGGTDVYLAKYNVLGSFQWNFRYGDSGGDIGAAVACDAAGNIALTGSASGNINFGGGLHLGTGGSDIYLAKLNASGGYIWSRTFGAPSFGDDGRGVAIDASGNVVCTGRFQSTADFGGGGIRSNGSYDGFVAKYGTRQSAPAITSVADIGNDQGRKVKIKFSGSGGDNIDSPAPVIAYEAYRRSDAPPAITTGGNANAPTPRPRENPEGLTPRQLLIGGWTFAGSVPAHQETNYSIDTPTIGDSTIALGQYYSVFFIRAATGTTNTFFDSPPDSGYSKDNLAPGVPSSFVFNAGSLTWNKSAADDFDYFTVYGSNTNSFGAATLVNYTVGTNMNVSASPYVYYYVTATDFSGNEGKPAKVNALSGVGGTPQSYVLSVTNYPNPFNPRTTVNYTVPSHGTVKVTIYDARGSLVKTLFDGQRAPGAYSIDWDGRADNGDAVASSVYFARIEQDSITRTHKMILLK